MLLIRGLCNVPKTIKNTAIALGDFDGVHLGHQAIIRRLIQEAKANHLQSILICFEPQPAEFFNKDAFVGRILRLREKCQALKNFDLDYLLCLAFNQKLANLSTETFVKTILADRLHCKRLIVGDDFRLGKNRQGCVNRLTELGQQYGFAVVAEKTFKVADQRDSSTRIRQALERGDFNLAERLMGRPYCLSGRVRYGHGRGRKLGYPTANIPLFHYKMATSGIFIVKVRYDEQEKYGVANLGIRPTFHEHQFVLEVYVLGFNGNLYGKTLDVEFLHKLRDEAQFDSIEALKNQMRKDVENAVMWLGLAKNN
jgi:riboflavin kinase/FMN adenylyltransferase